MKIELSTEERMQLADIVQSDAWKVVKKISDGHYRDCLESLLSASDSGDFRHTQGVAHGWTYLVTAIEQYAHPPSSITDAGISESSLDARKASY
jgi:hypothetical protein